MRKSLTRLCVQVLLCCPVIASALSLPEAEEQALLNNQQIEFAREQAEEARYRRHQARGRCYPAASFSASATRTPGAGNVGYKTFYLSNLRFSQALYDPNVYSDIKLRHVQHKEAKNRISGTENDVLFRVRADYYSVVLADKKIEVEEENIGLLEEAAEREEQRRESGDSTLFDVNQSKVSTQNARSTYFRVLREAKMARNDLLLALGEEPMINLELADSEIPVMEIPFLADRIERYEAGEEIYSGDEVWKWESIALSSRPEIERERLGLEVAMREAKRSVAQFIPSAGISATFVNTNRASNSFIGNNSYWNLVGDFQWTLFDGLQRENKIAERRHTKLAARVRYEEAILTAKAEVRNRFHEIEAALRSYIAARDSVSLAEQSLDQAKDRRDVGEITPLEYRDVTTSLTRARRDYYQASYDLLVSYFALRHTAGIDVEIPR